MTDYQLDKILHQPIRTRIVAYIAARGDVSFSDLKKALHITDGNLEAHLKKLISGQYIDVHKETGKARPQTLYSLSKIGEKAFKQYVKSLQTLLNFE